jgi:hypothetical protein
MEYNVKHNQSAYRPHRMSTKTVCTTGYTIDQHTNPDAVYDYIRDNWHDMYVWGNENVDSLKAFCDYFNLSGMDCRISPCSYSYASATIQDDDIANLSGVRLFKYIGHNFPIDLSGGCPFTGYCFDENLLDNIREFMKKPDSRTFQELINDCLDSWVKAYVSDLEYTYTDEALRDTCEANEWYFTESGEII